MRACLTASNLSTGHSGTFPISKLARPSSETRSCRVVLALGPLHPTQIEIAKKVFSPDAEEVAFAQRILEAMPDGTGAVMIDGKMQDDATWKQAKVIVDLARLVADKDPERAAAYGIERCA